jgi:hypothetical protein
MDDINERVRSEVVGFFQSFGRHNEAEVKGSSNMLLVE